MKLRSPLKLIKEEIIGSENTFHAWCVLIATLGVLAMGVYLNSQSVSFQGIAGSRESNLNFQYPVEIKNVLVLPGQVVKKGDLLIELDQLELDNRVRLLAAKIAKLKADKSVRDQMNRAMGNSANAAGVDPLAIEIRDQEAELEVLERQRNNLFVFADIDGIVGSVNFKKGETAPAFAALVTISPESPTFVQGFVYERLHPGIQVGSRVRVRSLTAEDGIVEGRVVSIGSRFIEIPERISQAPHGAPIWGREVMVEIPKSSALLLNERVVISPIADWMPNFWAHADIASAGQAARPKEQTAELRLPAALVSRTRIEASGAIYLEDLKKYLVVSKDTGIDNSPWLFLASADGEIHERTLRFPKMDSIKGAQSISADGNTLYILGSQSQFVRVQRRGLELYDAEVIDLDKNLRQILTKSKDPALRALASQPNLKMKSHAVRGGDLYLGLKTPENAVVVKIADVEKLFRKAATSLEVWKTLDLNRVAGGQQVLSDLTFVGSTLYFTSSQEGTGGGAFWSLEEGSTSPRLVRYFRQEPPEGVAFNRDQNIFFLTFDLGRMGSKYLALSGARLTPVN